MKKTKRTKKANKKNVSCGIVQVRVYSKQSGVTDLRNQAVSKVSLSLNLLLLWQPCACLRVCMITCAAVCYASVCVCVCVCGVTCGVLYVFTNTA